MAKKKVTTKRVDPKLKVVHPDDPPKPKRKRKTTRKKKEPSLPEEPEPDMLNHALMSVEAGTMLRRITDVNDLLNDPVSLQTIAQMVATGASTESVEAALGLHQGMLKGWIKNGKDNPESEFGIFRRFYTQAAATARHTAEAELLKRNPAAWLDRCDLLTHEAEAEPDTVEGTAVDRSDNFIPQYGTKEFDTPDS